MSRAFVLRADGGAELGIGHVRRCLTLAVALKARGELPVLVLRHTDEPVVNMVRHAEIEVHRLPPQMTYNDEPAALTELGIQAEACIVLDVSHRATFLEASAIPGYFDVLATCFRSVTVIDSMLHECLVGQFDLPVDLAVIPYAGADEQPVRTRGARMALGLEYFILDRAYAGFAGRPRDIAPAAERLLVTAGGSDPHGLTLKIFAALERLDTRPLELRIAIGPAFTDEAIEAIGNAAGASRHRVTLLDRPDDLARHMAWCDLAISASGLTKYELAATGTPAILLSADQNHVDFNRPFEKFQTARHLGVAKDIPIDSIAKSIEALVGDPTTRAEMSSAARTFLDGRGAERVASLIITSIDAAQSRKGTQTARGASR